MEKQQQPGAAAAAFFTKQLAYHKVGREQLLAEPVRLAAGQTELVLDWYPERSALAPLRIERNHVAVFAWSKLILEAGQKLIVHGPHQERSLLVIEHLHLAAGAQLQLHMPTELVVARCDSAAVAGRAGEAVAATIVVTAASGAAGMNGPQGGAGVPGRAPGSAGGNGAPGGGGSPGGNGSSSQTSNLHIGMMFGHYVFEINGGDGGDGGAGGAGGNGGAGGINPATHQMGMGGGGGSGGPGGPGGNAGNGGVLRVFTEGIAPGTTYELRQPVPRGGAGGAGGRGGIPGLGHPDGSPGMPGVNGPAGSDGWPGVIEIRVI
ncbi:hypothetical protein [Janthinobacterium agaricidamnosum]|uniref:Uncharacterized protein n=1 Tax=Janthinobacterium agaricidamnosum NBRC 102515 = DSM 9628 TaxID=1349767 RepID=W0V2S9_9BURK|nr:hypothetical protein [Janthinobacterium agaricidamnosum]CDG81658.1 hypothetical protein GJA_1003 [Janthinobacterium agaricidamnosum NBRC 102515 = DSM 9628]